jgi:hypothetical protein
MENTAGRKGRMLLVHQAHLLLIERGRRNARDKGRGKGRKPTVEEQIALLKLAVAAGGIDALWQWLNDLERQIKQKRGRPLGSGYENTDLMLIWQAYEVWRLSNPPILKRAAIARVVKAYRASNERGKIGGGTERSVIERLMRQDWPPPIARGMSPLKTASE